MSIHFSYNHSFVGKFREFVHDDKGKPTPVNPTTGEPFNPSKDWVNVTGSVADLFDIIQTGHAIAPMLSNGFDRRETHIYNQTLLSESYFGYRESTNFWMSSIACVDIDEDSSIQDTKDHEFYKEFGTGYYTSPSYTEENQKHRIVFVLEEPIKDEFQMRCVLVALIKVFGGDESCKDGARMFFASPDCQVEINDRFIPADVIQLLIEEGSKYIQKQEDWNGDTRPDNWKPTECNNTFTEDQIFYTTTGSIRAGDIPENTKMITGVFCPFHNDKKPGTFLARKQGNPWHHCNQCGTSKMLRPPPEEDNTGLIKFIGKHNMNRSFKKKKDKPKLPKLDNKPAVVCEPVYASHLSFTQREELFIREYNKAEQYKLLLLLTDEGFGKSYSVKFFVKTKRRKVLFTCGNNEQVTEQAKNFSERYGLRTQAIISREYRLWNEYKVAAVTGEDRSPWEGGAIKRNATIREIMSVTKRTEEEAELLYDSLKSADPNWNQYDVIVTTHDRARVWGASQTLEDDSLGQWFRAVDEHRKFSGYNFHRSESGRKVPSDVIIFMDDPKRSDFELLKDFDNRFVGTRMMDGNLIPRTTITTTNKNGDKLDFEYFVRPECMLFGFGYQDNQLLFCTTEAITGDFIKTGYEGVYEVPKLVSKDPLQSISTITWMKTSRVQKRWDGLLLPIRERLKKKGFETEYFADGAGTLFCHETVKGQNRFIGKNTIIKISIPPKEIVVKMVRELNYRNKGDIEYCAPEVEMMIASDIVHQDLGRNSGYRGQEGVDAIVLCDPRFSDAVRENCRYQISESINLVEDVPERAHQGDGLGKWCMWYIGNIRSYLVDSRFVEWDIKATMKDDRLRHRTMRLKRVLGSCQYAIKTFGQLPNIIRSIKWLEEQIDGS